MKAKKPGKIRSAVLNWLGVPVGLTDDSFWSWWASSRSVAGQTINEKTVLSLSAAWACTRLISESVATLPLKVYERTPSGRKPAVDHPLYHVLHTQPNKDSTAATYWEANVAAILLRGNGFSRTLKVGERVVGLEFMSPNRLSGSKDSSGNLQIRYTQRNGTQVVVPEDRIFRIPGFSLDGKWGISTIEYGAAVFGSALAATSAANSTFEKGLAQTVAFEFDKILKPEQRDDARKMIKTISGALNAGEPAILEGGLKASNIGIPPKDAQLLETRGYGVEEVCRWFRCDPSLVGHGNKDSNWGTGLEQKLIGFLTFTLRPWLTRIEQAINKDLLTPIEQQRYFAEFSIEGLLRADSAGRAAFYSVMVNNGIFTRDEVRALESMPLMGGNAEVLTVQTALAPLDSLGSSTDGDAARSALAAWLRGGHSGSE